MAQFGKSLFGSSYFGYTNTLDGDYQTEIIDASEPFDGKVDFKIWTELPKMSYDGNDMSWTFLPLQTDWAKQGNNIYTEKKDSYAMFFMSSDIIEFDFDSNSKSICTIDIISPRDNSIIKTETVDTSKKSKATITIPFQMVNIKIKNTEAKRLELKTITGRVTTFGIDIRTKGEKGEWTDFDTVDINYDESEQVWKGSSKALVQTQYVQARIHLGTSDYETSPIISKIIISSGDTSKRSNHGYWSCALHMDNIAEEQKTTFKKIKKIKFNRDLPENALTDVRTTSTLNTFPNKEQIKDDTYWKPETAPYMYYKNTRSNLGTPWSRIRLPKKLTSSYVIGFEMSPETFRLTNSKIVQWLSWNDQSLFPTDSAGTSISYKIYENQNDYEKGIPPIYIINNPERIVDRKLALPARFLKRNLYVYIEINRTSATAKQTPVVDFMDIIGDVNYKSPVSAGSKNKEISALDNGTGIANQEEFNSSRYDWPSNNQVLDVNKESLLASIRTLTIKYTPLFSNQIEFYFKKKENETTNRNRIEFPSSETYIDAIYSKVIADEPVASTYEAPNDRIIFHYAMDGGTVQYPKETKKDLLTDFTPNLLKNIQYQFRVDNGWPDETFTVPYAMTWDELADATVSKKEELIEINPVEEYNGKIPQDVILKIPNHTANPLVQVKFESNNSSYSRKSLWNGLENDKIVAKIPSNKDFGYKEWISEEKIYEGYINPNNIRSPYIRTQKAVYSPTDEYEYIVRKGDTYTSIAKNKGCNELDLIKRNNEKELVVGESITIPASFALPYIAPEVIYENENPFIIEIIPFSVYKKNSSYKVREEAELNKRTEFLKETNNLLSGTFDFSGNWNNKENWTVEKEKYNNLTVLSRSNNWYGVSEIIKVKAKETYNFSAYIKTEDGAEADIYLFKNADASNPNMTPARYNIPKNDKWERYDITFSIVSDGEISPRIENKSGKGKVYIAGLKLTKDINSKEWTPSKNDNIKEIKSAYEYSNIIDEGSYEPMPEESIILGSDTDDVLKYTFVESEAVTNEIKRGPVLNGRDALLYSNPQRVFSVVDVKTGYIYQPYSRGVNGVETGDYILKDGYIDWSPAHKLAKEPLTGAWYKVTYTYNTVDTLRITMTSDYVEKSGYNKLWKSPEIKEVEGIANPEEDFKYKLPPAKDFKEYSDNLTDIEYLVEDNDLWIKTFIKKIDGEDYLIGTMNRENPKRNWYPTINTGFYFLQNQEYYMYSSPLEHNFSEEALPIIKDISYQNGGGLLSATRCNLLLDSSIKSIKKEKIK